MTILFVKSSLAPMNPSLPVNSIAFKVLIITQDMYSGVALWPCQRMWVAIISMQSLLTKFRIL
jgi:hypothetical protein